MKGRAIAAVLAALTVFGAAPSASARHLAEEYIERVHRERRERLEEEARDARLREQAETRRRAAEEWERRDAERRAVKNQEDEEDVDEELEEEEQNGARGEREARTTEERRQIEAQEEEARERERQTEETEKHQPAEAEQKAVEEVKRAAESEQKTAGEAKRQPETTTEEADVTTGESFLQQLLRRARERTQGVAAALEGKPSLHVVKEYPMKLLHAEFVDTGGTLLFSDSPEYVRQPGVLYTDVVKGDARVFYYHLNDTKKKYKVAVVLENVDGQYAVVRVTRRATAAPSTDYFKVGKGLQQAYFSDEHGTEKMYIASEERRLLLEEMDKTILNPGELVSGMVDFTASAPVRVTVLCYPANKNPLKYVDEAEVLPADEHRLRGTFIGMDRVIRLESYDPEDDGVACVVLVDGERDKYHAGVDATDGSLVTNVGNYGMLYRIEASSRYRAKYFLSPMGGAFAGALRIEAGASGTKLVNVPDGRVYYFGENSFHPPLGKENTTTLPTSAELSELGTYRAKPPIFFEFSPPGASNLPVLLILAPEDLKTEEGKGKS